MLLSGMRDHGMAVRAVEVRRLGVRPRTDVRRRGVAILRDDHLHTMVRLFLIHWGSRGGVHWNEVLLVGECVARSHGSDDVQFVVVLSAQRAHLSFFVAEFVELDETRDLGSESSVTYVLLFQFVELHFHLVLEIGFVLASIGFQRLDLVVAFFELQPNPFVSFSRGR